MTKASRVVFTEAGQYDRLLEGKGIGSFAFAAFVVLGVSYSNTAFTTFFPYI